MRRPLVILLVTLVTPVAVVAQSDSAPTPDPIAQLVGRLDLERYKATIKGLTAFGDRRQGTDRNRAAVDWIEAQLRGYGCSNVSRLKYDYQPPVTRTGNPPPRDTSRASGGGRYRGIRARTGVNSDSLKQPDARARTRRPTFHRGRARRGLLHEDRHDARGRDVHRRRPHGRDRLGRGGK